MFSRTRQTREAEFVNTVLDANRVARAAYLINFKEKSWKLVAEAETMIPFIINIKEVPASGFKLGFDVSRTKRI